MKWPLITKRDVFWLVVAMALGAGWWCEHGRYYSACMDVRAYRRWNEDLAKLLQNEQMAREQEQHERQREYEETQQRISSGIDDNPFD